MHKKPVLNVDQKTLSYLAKQDNINNGFDVKDAIKLLFGKILITKDTVKSIGSDYGLKKVTVSASFANYLGIVLLSLKTSENIGSAKLLKSHKIINTLNMLSMMALIFIKMAV